jgi:choline dehydrogenase-like flavoprotein
MIPGHTRLPERPPDWSHQHDILSALAYTCAHSIQGVRATELASPSDFNDLTRFMVRQQVNLPDYLGSGIRLTTLLFDAAGLVKGGFFHALPPEKRLALLQSWKSSPIGFQRDFARYYESLSALALFSREERMSHSATAPLHVADPDCIIRSPEPQLRGDIVVIGSGPGGAITACTLAEGGREVLLIEEGPFLSLDSCAPFSKSEMLQKYRNGGQNVAMGRNKVAYVEGRCVGGGSEINSGLYHRTPPDILDAWRKSFDVEALSPDDLAPHFAQCEEDLSVGLLQAPAPAASLKLHEGALKLGWKSMEVPRWYVQGRRQSMTETYIPRFLKAGGRILPDTRALRLHQESGKWIVEAQHRDGTIRILAGDVFLAGGAVQTPALLLRSGIRQNIGGSLQLHPTLKVVAQFKEQVNSAEMGVPVHQVKEFAPRISFGCSISSRAYLGLGLLERPEVLRQLDSTWTCMANYYAMHAGDGSGTVALLPGYRDPLVRYRLGESGRRDLASGLRDLCRLLLEAGATQVYPGVAGVKPVDSSRAVEELPKVLANGSGNLMTIHLFSSCPMGENRKICATNSFGKVHGFDHLYINDASLLCGAPGVNPQGSVMAIARRNALAFLAGSGGPG